ncbi:MAG: hypothetical protein ABSG84_13760 [Acidobacteriaceae bacterium]|jgi:hypothetical protein
MASHTSILRAQKLCLAFLLSFFAAAFSSAQDIKLNVTYVCNGERIYVESCNIRDTSDTSTCQVAHPDRPQHNGFMAYTSETRGTLKKLFPTCTQPTAAEIAREDAFQKKQQQIIDAQTPKYNTAPAPTQASVGQSLSASQVAPPRNAEERAIRRCISSGRLPATCTGNLLLGAFSNMISSTVSSLTGVTANANAGPNSGPDMSGVFQGAGNWRLDFVDGGVLVNCSFLSPNQEPYSIAFRGTGPVLTINTTPKPLVLSVHADGTITGPPGPVTIDGVVAGGSSGGSSTPGHTETHDVTTHEQINSYQVTAGNAGQVTNTGGGTYDLATTTQQSTYVPGTYTAPQTTFVPRRATCPAINLSSKGAGVGIQTMQTNLLKSIFNDGDTGPPTPVGIRMHGIYAAASTGFSVQFFPESVILGCGPDSARAYPYTVSASGGGAVIKVDAPDHPLTLTLRADNTLDPGSGPYQVHGRIVTGESDNGDYTFAPMEQTCNLAALSPSKEIPSSGGTAATMMVSATTPGTASNNNGGRLSTPEAPLGNATLSIVSGLPPQPGSPNPLAGRPYILLRDSYAGALAKGGLAIPSGVSPYKYALTLCAPTRTPDCQKVGAAVNSSAASAVRADANGSGTFPGVPPGTYYLMISAIYNKQTLVWGQAVQLKPGANSLTLNPREATPIN